MVEILALVLAYDQCKHPPNYQMLATIKPVIESSGRGTIEKG